MSIGATLLGQMITFLLFALFTMRFVWPPVQKAMQDRQTKIAEGLAAAERGHHDLELAQKSAAKQLKEAKIEVSRLMDDAKRQADQIVEEAKMHAKSEGERIIAHAQSEVEQLERQAREALSNQIATFALQGAEKVLGKQIDAASHQQMLNQLVEEL